MRWFLIVLAIFISFNAVASDLFIDLHYAFVEKGPWRRIIKKNSYVQERKNKMLEKLKTLGIKTREIENSKTADIVKSLRDPNVVGVFWVGHTREYTIGKGEEEKVVNSFMLEPKIVIKPKNPEDEHDKERTLQRYMPKSTFTAAHKNLMFFSSPTCRIENIYDKYNLRGKHFILHVPPSFERPAGENRMEMVASVAAATGASYLKIAKDIEELFKLFKLNRKPKEMEEIKLTIKYRDLKSNVFAYEVLVDNKMVGLFRVNSRTIGTRMLSLSKGKAEITFQLEKSSKSHTLKIVPDDPKRVTVKYPKPVDDILVDSVVMERGGSKTELLKSMVHIGDNDDDVDRDINMSWIKHRNDFEKTKRQDFLEIKF